ncbi:MFS transporter [Bradyrhizobium sp. LHD-71]|uniref:MFS transporter n=1 Tax=Bradyrhizobium sp. LHD-71 TaxID=3072141 RepID=UPI00280CF6F9|nr:MFS transporter [Bradyrhizobium sp. LHD-71]MDQ8728672.1 MFS transporter [Bradyrhizobium sp. LHD-71]
MPTRQADASLPLYRVLLAIGGVYLVQSLISGLTFNGVPAALRSSGASLDSIGLVSLVMVPWALKFIWAPAIERYRLPHGRPRRSRQVVAMCQVVAMLSLVALAFVGPLSVTMVLACLAVMAFASATADIACDGFAIQQLSPADRGWGNTAQVGGGYLGIVVGGGLFLILIPSFGWTAACLAMSALVVVLTLPFLATPEPGHSIGDHAPHRPSLGYALRRSEVQAGLVVVTCFEIGVRLTQGISAPFLVDRGFDLATLGYLTGGGAIVSAVLGTVLGGLAIRRHGPRRSVVAAVGLQTLAVVVLASVSLVPTAPLWCLGTVVVLKSVAMAFGFVCLYSLLMGYASPRQAGVDFTLFQCADALVAALAGFAGGVVAQRTGYPIAFWIAAVLGIGACAALPLLLRRAGAAERSGAAE